MDRGTRKWLRVGAIAIVLLALAAALAAHLATRAVEKRIVTLLGPLGHAGAIHVGLHQVVLEDVVIGAPAGWPARETLRARRLVFEPSWRELLAHRTVIRRVVGTDVYLSVRRNRNGRLEVLPTLRRTAAAAGAQGADATAVATRANGASAASAAIDSERRDASAVSGASGEAAARPRRPTDIGQIIVESGQLDYYDAVVATPPYRLRIDDFKLRIDDLHFPPTNAHTAFDLQGRLHQRGSGGTLHTHGWIALASSDVDIETRLRQADVTLLAPYLMRRSPGLLAGGTADLTMRTRVRHPRLDANGRLDLHDLRLGEQGTLAALPREVVLAALEDHKGVISLDFTLSGDLKDPKFSLDEGIATRFAAGFARALGVSSEGVAKGLGETAKGLGGALLNLIGQ
ncbi:DUF748 domain-containing protein [Chitinasiproducens palmae]|uniref:DUF748 domain-containing protein n=1 Tax=Chitinasiproducens palmae TaxID=1770053 RepID=A0A1H2PTI9_9BURK|nr:DUF748 domain-containing protein [Chitinasiproducens palmae]SDV50419.1 protein of unknown function [Chitinasiproducens palmae]